MGRLKSVLKGVFSLILLAHQFDVCHGEDNSIHEEVQKLNGLNVCLETINETTLMNVSYNVIERDHSSHFCLTSFTFKCLSYKDVLRDKYKMKNVTRKRSHRVCCEGYEREGNACLPSCEGNPCLKGTCTDPGVCSCQPGFSGIDCSEIGCPDPQTWGQDCSNVCECEKGTSTCNPKDGSCSCFPGYGGDHCESLCPPNTYGPNCSGSCHCTRGSRCHHVTGNCVPCDPGYFGDHCRTPCACFEEGTLLCHPGNGFCVCKPGYYGVRCQDHCPFGMKEGKCHKESIPGEVCACRDEVAVLCDPLKGCICQIEGACENYALPVVASSSPQSNRNLEASTLDEGGEVSSSSIALSVVLTLICLIVLCGALYYRRRFKRAQQDLHNRVAFFTKSSSDHTAAVDNEYEVIVTHPNKIPRTTNNNNSRKDLKNANNAAQFNNKNLSEPVASTSGRHYHSNNLYEEIGSPTGTKNNELLSAHYKKNAKQTSINAALRDPLNWAPQEAQALEEEENVSHPDKKEGGGKGSSNDPDDPKQ
eukprot:TRINITY_DN1496_c0_g1_i3.p1 TRINITY_DN1496_c0_g1~~TRINITY_DN1496_c0_g1_i3.p1  ORF type:complete len:532 (-),score=104.06 TRINITY_DN1496_c0_g1_i3:197-1792(-)